MDTTQIRNSQDLFMKTLTGSKEAEKFFLSLLEKPNDPRIEVYKTGYKSRLIETSCESLLPRLYFLIGEQLKLILDAYFNEFPPSCDRLDLICEHLPNYLSSYAPDSYWADLSTISIKTWQVLNGCDIESHAIKIDKNIDDLNSIHLTPSHFFIVSQHPIFDLWNSADPDNKLTSNQIISAQEQGVLIHKANCLSLFTTKIHPSLSDFVKYLSEGSSLINAMQQFFASNKSNMLEPVKELISILNQQNAFIKD